MLPLTDSNLSIINQNQLGWFEIWPTDLGDILVVFNEFEVWILGKITWKMFHLKSIRPKNRRLSYK